MPVRCTIAGGLLKIARHSASTALSSTAWPWRGLGHRPSPTARLWHGYGRAGTRNDRLDESFPMVRGACQTHVCARVSMRESSWMETGRAGELSEIARHSASVGAVVGSL